MLADNALLHFLAQLWCQVLKLDKVSRQAQFFALGGHSLLAMRLIAAIRQQLALELPVRLVFEAPVLEELPQSIKDEIAAEQAEPEPEFPWGLVIGANLFILFGGGFAIWFVMTDKKLADLQFWRKKDVKVQPVAATAEKNKPAADKNSTNAQKNNDMDDILDLTLPDD